MDIQKVLTGLLVKAYKMTTEEITELLASDDEGAIQTALLEKDKTRIADVGKTKYQEAFKKVKGETLTEFEKSLKDNMEIESDLTGIDLIKHILEAKAGSGDNKGGKGKEITEDDVKKHSAYQTLLEQSKKQLTAKDSEWQTKLEEAQKGFTKEKTLGTVKERALNLLKKDTYVLPENETVAANQKAAFAKQLEEYDFEVQGDRTVVMKDGKVVDDGHGNPVSFEDLVASKADSFFPKAANNGGGNSGNNNNGGKQNEQGNNGKKTFTGQLPKTFEDLTVKMNDTTIPQEDRGLMLEAWEAANPNG